MMYLLFYPDGSVKEVDDLPADVKSMSWPVAIEIRMFVGGDIEAYKLRQSGWEKVTGGE